MIPATHLNLPSGKKTTGAVETNASTTRANKEDKQSERDGTFDALLALFVQIPSSPTTAAAGSASHTQATKSKLLKETEQKVPSSRVEDSFQRVHAAGRAVNVKQLPTRDGLVQGLTLGNADTSILNRRTIDVGSNLVGMEWTKNHLVPVKGGLTPVLSLADGTVLDDTKDPLTKRLTSDRPAGIGDPLSAESWPITKADSSPSSCPTEFVHQPGYVTGQSAVSSNLGSVWHQATENLSVSSLTGVHASNAGTAPSGKSSRLGEHVGQMPQSKMETTPMLVSATQGLVQPTTSYRPETGSASTEHVVNVEQPGWSQSLASAMSLHVASGNTGTLSIHVHPEGLGSILIQAVHGADGVVLNVSSSNPHMVDLLNQSTPELKSTLTAQGVTLSDVSVSYDGNMQQGQDSHGRSQRNKPVFALTRSSERTAESSSRVAAMELRAPLQVARGTTISMQV